MCNSRSAERAPQFGHLGESEALRSEALRHRCSNRMHSTGESSTGIENQPSSIDVTSVIGNYLCPSDGFSNGNGAFQTSNGHMR